MTNIYENTQRRESNDAKINLKFKKIKIKKSRRGVSRGPDNVKKGV